MIHLKKLYKNITILYLSITQ